VPVDLPPVPALVPPVALLPPDAVAPPDPTIPPVADCDPPEPGSPVPGPDEPHPTNVNTAAVEQISKGESSRRQIIGTSGSVLPPADRDC
jgi:hypothetical protein